MAVSNLTEFVTDMTSLGWTSTFFRAYRGTVCLSHLHLMKLLKKQSCQFTFSPWSSGLNIDDDIFFLLAGTYRGTPVNI